MSWVRAIALGVAMIFAWPEAASAQVWKPVSKQKKKSAKPAAGKTKAKIGTTKTRKAGAKKAIKRAKPSPKKTKKATAKKKSVKKKPPVTDDDDDDFTIIEEDFPDED